MFARLKRRLKRFRRKKWMPGAARIPGRDAGVMDRVGGTRKVTVHTEGVTRGHRGCEGNAINLARYVQSQNIGYHFTYDYHGRFAQLYTPLVGSRALLAGPWSPNRQGEVNIQVCFAGVSDASDVAHWPMKNWDKFLDFCDSWGVPRESITDFSLPSRSERKWRRSGWTCHAAAPFNDHTDGRGAPVRKLLRRASD